MSSLKKRLLLDSKSDADGSFDEPIVLLDSESDADDSLDETNSHDAEKEAAAIDAQIRILQARKAVIRSKKRHKTQNLTFTPLERSKIEKLEQIQKNGDKNLQRILWELGCNFELMDHQFLGVRKIAGVSDDFLSKEIQLETTKQKVSALQSATEGRDNDHGILMADVMGLGKTVQTVAACVIRNAMATTSNQPMKPTVICAPNDAVLDQWKEHLLKAGVDQSRIFRFKPRWHRPISGDMFLLCTRYDFQAEAKYVLENLNSPLFRPSPLFPNAPKHLLDVLNNQYLYCHHKAANKYKYFVDGKKLSINSVITKHLEGAATNALPQSQIFRTVIIDEAHFLKSLKTYWGLAAGLISVHSERVIPLTGTPYNNSLQDMASLMTYVDPRDPSAMVKFWEDATEEGAAAIVRQKISKWDSRFLLRREKDIIADKLPAKLVRQEEILEKNLFVYEKYEKAIIPVFSEISQLAHAGKNSKALQDALKKMLAVAACMQLSLVHPILPENGRQLTVLFSPSLRHNNSIKRGLEKKHQCVCCQRRVWNERKKKSNARVCAAHDLDDLEDDDPGRDEEILPEEYPDVNNGEDQAGKPFSELTGTGSIVAIPSRFCQFATQGIRHFACESCLEEMRDGGEACPMCNDLISRNKGVVNSETTGRIYCQDIFGGFEASVKLESIVKNFMDVPSQDKVMIVSFFKGSLDLLEAMFLDHEVEVARFDGDLKASDRAKELERFKKKESCRVLLMTVQTGGTGLNIMEANHVWFVDRYWNPMVMEQCEDRAYRIGQTKKVNVSYHDVPLTIDEVMRDLNKVKATNASIVLSDRVSISNTRVSFKDLSGYLGRTLTQMRESRQRKHRKNGKNAVPVGVTGDYNPEIILIDD